VERIAFRTDYNRLQLLQTIADILQSVSNDARLATPARDQTNRSKVGILSIDHSTVPTANAFATNLLMTSLRRQRFARSLASKTRDSSYWDKSTISPGRVNDAKAEQRWNEPLVILRNPRTPNAMSLASSARPSRAPQ
jgi:hypothetical protein